MIIPVSNIEIDENKFDLSVFWPIGLVAMLFIGLVCFVGAIVGFLLVRSNRGSVQSADNATSMAVVTEQPIISPPITMLTSPPTNNAPLFATNAPTLPNHPIETSKPTQTFALISNEIAIEVNLRNSPGFSSKNDAKDVITKIPKGEIVEILSGPKNADGLNWWQVSWHGYEGWMADHTASGKRILIFNP
jgi:hypothetical protein